MNGWIVTRNVSLSFYLLEWNTHQHTTPTIMIIKMDTFGYMTPNYTQQYGSFSFITRFSIIINR